MDRLTENPFDQSHESQKRQFETFISSPEEVNKTARWYIENLNKIKWLGIEDRDFPHRPIADHYNFPGKVSERVLEAHFEPKIAGKIAAKINGSPYITLNSPNIPPLISPIKRMHDFDMLLTGLTSDKTDEQKQAKQDEIKQRNLQKIKELAKIMELDESEVSYEDFAQLSSEINASRQLLMDALYFRFVLDQAVLGIKKIAPSLQNKLDEVIENVVLVRSGLSDNDSQIEPSYLKVGDLHGITVQKDIDTDNFDRNHAFRIMATGHELLHALTYDMLGIPGHRPGFAGRINRDLLDSDEAAKYENQQRGSLGGCNS